MSNNPWSPMRFKLFRPLVTLLALALGAVPCPDLARADLPPGEPTFFAGNPATRHLAFRYRVGLRAVGWTDDRTGLHGLFSQSSFWFLDNEDRGYTVESNYEPEVMLFVEGSRLGGWWPERLDLGLSYSHHSNGIDGELSRSWNHINGGLYLGRPDRDPVSGSVIAWWPFNQEIGNEDIAAYAGHGRLTVCLNPRQPVGWLGRTELYLASNFSFERVFLTNLEASLSFSPPWLAHPPFANGHPRFALFVQWILGRGESLIEYRDYQNTLRLGLAIDN
jgi:hypothetical protein